MQNRLIIAFVLFVSMLFLAGSASRIAADDSGFMEAPIAFAAIAGVERFEEDLNRLSEISQNPTLSGTYLLLKTQLIQFPGIDTSRPIGAAIWLQRETMKDPALVGIVPVSDGQSLMKALQRKFTAIKELDEHRWEVQTRKRKLHFHLVHDSLLVSNDSQVFNLFTRQLLNQINEQLGKDDVAAQLSLAGLSDVNRQAIMRHLQNELEKESQRQPSESEEEFEFRSQLMRFIGTACQQVIVDSQTISAGLDIESNVDVHFEWRAKPTSELSDKFARLPVHQPQVAIALSTSSPFQADFAIGLPDEMKVVLLQGFKLARHQIRKEIGPKLAAADRGPVSEVFNAISETVRRGEVNGLVTFAETDNQQMILVAGLRVVRSDLVQQFLKTVLPYAQDTDDIKSVDVGFYESESLSLHRLQGRKQRAEDRHLYGESAALYVGTSLDAFWIANGGDGTPAVVKSLMQTNSKTRDHALVRAKFSLDPWLKVAEKNQQDLGKIRFVRRAFEEAADDEINFELKAGPDKLTAQLLLEEGYLKLFGIALKEELRKQTGRK